MAVCFRPLQELGPEDLDINLTNSSGAPTNAAYIRYAIYFVDPTTGLEMLVGDPERVPINPSVGTYYASLILPGNSPAGDYVIRWSIRQTVNSTTNYRVMEFGVVTDGSTLSSEYSDTELALVRSLRIKLRDNNPDRNYHFRPATGEGVLKAQTKVFGQVWEDEELIEYLNCSLDLINMYPPETCIPSLDKLVSTKRSWRTLLLEAAIFQAARAVTFNWIVDEFDYSIGGISLSINKASAYQSMMENAQSQFDKFVEAAKATVKITMGLRQSRFGFGVRSAFGPAVRPGVSTPKNFVTVF